MEFVFLQTAEKDAPSPFQLIKFSLRELFGAGVALLSLHLFRRKSDSIGVIHPFAYSTPDASLPLPGPDGSTRVSFGAYRALPLVILAAFDDGRLNGRTLCLALAALLMVAGACVYIRSHRPIVKVTALLSGLSLALVAALLDQYANLHRIDLAQTACMLQ
jgi:hypothetical protein